MNRLASGTRLVLFTIAIGLFGAGLASAGTQCPGGEAPPCEPIVVKDTRDPPPFSCQEMGMCEDLQGLNDMFAFLTSAAAAALTGPEKVIQALKAGQCKKASEDCATWGQRMTTPKGALTPNGQGTGTGFCQTVSVGLLAVATAICTNAVNLEVSAENCSNVSCPQI